MEDRVGTYIKLYRKLLDNKKLMKDLTSLGVFIWLLLRADYKTGEIETGRFAMAHDLGINPNTLYSSLLRLSRNYKLINIKSNNKYSVISIVNWDKFNGPSTQSVNNKSTTNQQQINTIQEYKEVNKYTNNNREFFEAVENKDERYENLIRYLVNEKNIPDSIARLEIGKFYNYWTEPNRSGTKVRWEMEKTFEVQRRLLNWLSRVKIPQRKGGKSYD